MIAACCTGLSFYILLPYRLPCSFTGSYPANPALISTKSVLDFLAKYVFSLEISALVTYFLTIFDYFAAQPGITQFGCFFLILPAS
jgi:hypothetical protein